MMELTDTHIHLDGEEFAADLPEVIERARAAGVNRVFIPAIDLNSATNILSLCRHYPGYAYPMIGLHPEEVRDDYREVLAEMRKLFTPEVIAVGEVGLDFYWSREFEKQQIEAFEQQVQLHQNKIAVKYKNKEITYKTLDENTNKVANKLMELNVKPGTLIILFCDRNDLFLTAFLGVFKSGGVIYL